jgi:predicted Zn-dependent peptidase
MSEISHVSTLPSGLQVATWTMPNRRGISIGIWAKVGGLNEAEPECGVSHFIEHMLFKGTAKRTPLAITQDVEAVGGDLNAYTTAESTCYYAIAPARHAGTLLEVLADMLLNSTLPEKEIERERQVIKEEILMTRDQPDELVNEELQTLLWPRHPLGRPLTGTPETLAYLDRKRLRDFLGRNYTARNLIVAAAGPIAHETFVGMVEKEFANVSQAAPLTLEPGMPEGPENAWRLIPRPVEQTQLNLAFRAIPRADERRYTMALLDTLLGGSMSSRLFQTLRERMALCYSIESSAAMYAQGGALEIQAGLDTAKFPKALRAILEETDRFCQAPVPEAELARAREYVIGQTELGLESTSARLSYLGESLLGYGRVLDPDEETERLRAVTAGEIQALAQTVFTRKNLSLAAVAPEEGAKHVHGALEDILPQGHANAGLLVA